MPPMDVLVNAINEILARYDPGTKLTLRQIYYQLVARHIIVNNEKAYKSLSRILVQAREQGLVDDRRIEDRNRETIGGDYRKENPDNFFSNHLESFRNCWKYYSRPMWQDQPRYVEVFLEKDALSRLVSDVANQYGVKTCVCKGYSSYTFLNDAATRICKTCYPGTATKFENFLNPIILYLGDLDPSGVDMTRDLGARLERYGVPGGSEIIHRIALTPEQVKKYDLPPEPAKGSDSRARKFIEEYGEGTVELDALDPEVLQGIVKDSIVECIDAHIWNENAKKSNEEVARIHEQVEEYFRGRE